MDKLVSEALKLLEAPAILFFAATFILWAHKQIRAHYHAENTRSSESLTRLVNYVKDHGYNDPFIIEQLFMDHFKAQIPYRGIKLFLNSETPTENIFQYRSGRRMLNFSKRYREIEFYKNREHLVIEKCTSWAQYLLFGFAGVWMLLSSHLVIEYDLLAFVAWYTISIYFCFMALMGLGNAVRVKDAYQLVEKFGGST